MSASDPWRYESLRELVRGEPLPLMLVDLDVLDENTRRLSAIASSHGKSLRLASKSVRVPGLIRHVMETGGECFRGLMCFSAREAAFLGEQGFDDLLVAYPTVQDADLDAARDLVAGGRTVTLMLDSAAHVERLSRSWLERRSGGDKLRVCIDLDMSWRPLGRHVGVQRSPVRSVEDFAAVLDAVLAAPELELAGVMGYEAQIAGLGDQNPFAPALNTAKKLIKQGSRKDVAAKREAVARLLADRGVKLAFFNGGGTGSIRTTALEDWITEVTAGSGFLQSHLFDYYAANQNRAAFAFALQVTRFPQNDHATCQSGGFIASGPTEADKAPVPFRPAGLKLTKAEGCGEVQTPLVVPVALRATLALGDPVFFRPAKAGEIAERFDEYLLKRGGEIVDRVPTYRGLGRSFY